MHLITGYLFGNPHNLFFGRAEWADAVIERCSEKLHKIIQNAVVMEHFFNKGADLQSATF